MILADKIIINRKKLNLSQEGLGQEINVSRQAVSKWESGQSIPEMEKIISLSDLFGVSVDYLIRDEIDDVEYLDSDQMSKTKKLSLNEANLFLQKSQKSSSYVSLGVMLSIVSPIILIILTSLTDLNLIGISKDTASGLGIAAMLILISMAVGLFIFNGSLMSDDDYLEKEYFELEYGVQGIVRQKQKDRSKENTINNITGVIFIILSLLPVIISNGFRSKVFNQVYAVPLMLLFISLGVYILVKNGIKEGAFSKILQVKDYSQEKKRTSMIYGKISTIYWLSAVTLYLGYSFIYSAWDMSWVIWPIAGVLFPVVLVLASFFIKED